MELDSKIRALAESLGADRIGVADLTTAHQEILEQWGPEVAQYPRAVSLGIGLFHDIVDQLPRRDERAVAIAYRHHCYDLVNERLDLIASRVSSDLQAGGFRVLPVPASRTVNDERLCGAFSHKMAAHLAGLGWIGKSCLLITPEVGPRVRWATVFTDAPLAATGRATPEQCGSCLDCVEICPVKAFTGRPFRPDEPRAARYHARLCERYLARLKEKDTIPGVCGLCLYVCPYGRRQIGPA